MEEKNQQQEMVSLYMLLLAMVGPPQACFMPAFDSSLSLSLYFSPDTPFTC